MSAVFPQYRPTDARCPVAEQNVRRAFPELSDAEVTDLLERIWHNLGQGAANSLIWIDSWPMALTAASHSLAKSINPDAWRWSCRHRGFGTSRNWELAAPFQQDRDIVRTDLPGADNPFIDRLFKKARTEAGITLVPKGGKALSR